MIFYGTRVRSVVTGEALAGAAEALFTRPDGPPIMRHAGLIEALILIGELAQGVADAAFLADGFDDASPAERAIMRLAHRAAILAGRSWESDFEVPTSATDDLARLVLRARAAARPERVTVRQPEGYAHYAVYPESYWLAAREFGPVPSAQVIGIRSIGTSLSAMVAAGLSADVPLTVRPAGHPFAREIRAGARLDAALGSPAPALRAIVDEGPGLSGSSFGAVVDGLEQRGRATDPLRLFPSHVGPPGPQASMQAQLRWKRIPRHVVDFDRLALEAAAPAHRLETWVSDITGARLGPMLDLSAGAWRPARCGPEPPWPPCDPQNERRKFLLHAERGTFLLKFAGLGTSGRQTFCRAQALAAGGFSLAPLGLRHGFMVEPWREDLRPLDLSKLDRPAFLVHLGTYLGFRARALPAESDSGASLNMLFDMMCENAREANAGLHAGLARWGAHLPKLARRVHRVQTDNRLHVWEWLSSADRGWIKTDAVDHCAGHDLVGCQDLAWDAAGGSIEFGLTPEEEATLLANLDRAADRPVERNLFRFCRAAYAAFQLGAFSMARERSGGEDARRLGQLTRRYAEVLAREADGALQWLS